MISDIPPAVLASIFGVTMSAFFILIGIAYRTLQRRIATNEDRADAHDVRLSDLEQQVPTVFSWAFGNKKDSTDKGFAGDIHNKIQELDQRIERLDELDEERYKELSDKIDELILYLDDEGELTFDRDDID
jgi:hypothetical protein